MNLLIILLILINLKIQKKKMKIGEKKVKIINTIKNKKRIPVNQELQKFIIK